MYYLIFKREVKRKSTYFKIRARISKKKHGFQKNKGINENKRIGNNKQI